MIAAVRTRKVLFLQWAVIAILVLGRGDDSLALGPSTHGGTNSQSPPSECVSNDRNPSFPAETGVMSPQRGIFRPGSTSGSQLSLQPGQTVSGYKDDEVFGTYEGYNLDRYLFIESSPIRFPIDVTRVFSRNGDDYDDLIIGTPQLVLRVWDVDADCGTACNGCCEVDEVYFNGEMIGYLDGANESWSVVTLDVPADLISGATYVGPGSEPTPGENWIEVHINTTGCWYEGESCWAVEVDYGELLVQGIRPALLVHGLFSESGAWNQFREFIPGDLCEAVNIGAIGRVFSHAATIRETHIPNTLTAFGTTELNLIGHSRGGIEGEIALLGQGAKAENLITLGSPLLGTEYADHLLYAHPEIDWFVAPWLQWFAGFYDLTTQERMQYYQAHPSPTPGIQEYHFAGTQYDEDDTHCILPWCNHKVFDVSNDGWVPSNRTFPGWKAGPDLSRENSHTEQASLQPPSPSPPNGMLHDPAVAQWAVSLMRNSVGNSGTQRPRRDQPMLHQSRSPIVQGPAPESTPAITQKLPVPSCILEPSETKRIELYVDSAISELRPYVVFEQEAAGLQAALISPDSEQFELSLDSDWSTFMSVIADPAPGVWLLELQAEDSVAVQGGVEIETTLLLTASADREQCSVGESFQFTAHLQQSGSPVGGATVALRLRDGEAFVDSLVLTEDGNGSYSGDYSPQVHGRFVAEITGEGTLSGQPFARLTYVPNLVVLSHSASLTEIVSENAPDNDGDALLDYLAIDVGVDVAVAGDYVVIAALMDSAGYPVADAACWESLSSGSSTVPLIFDGSVLRESWSSGPYSLSMITVLDLAQDGARVDTLDEPYATQAYDFWSFEGPVLDLGLGSEEATDWDQDGDYDQLSITLGIVVSTGFAGTYAFNAQLQDSSETGIEWPSDTYQSLHVGRNEITLFYSGSEIGLSGLDGPYEVHNLHLYNLSDPAIRLSVPEAYTTSFYQACQFEGATPCQADLSITKIARPSNVALGDTLVYEIDVANNGPNISTGVTVIDSLPETATLVSILSSGGECVEVADCIECAAGNLSYGDSIRVVLTMLPTQVGELRNKAFVSSQSTDPDLTDNTAAALANVAYGTGIGISPSPYVPGRGHTSLTLFGAGLPYAKIKIYDKAGVLVRSLEETAGINRLDWDATNDDGKALASGVYIWVATNQAGNTERGKFAIIR